RDPVILDWETSRDLTRDLPELPVFVPAASLDHPHNLDYLDDTIDVVAIASREPARVREAERVASAAVVVFEDEAAPSGAASGARRPPAVTWLDHASSYLPSVSIVVPCYDGLDHTRVCLDTLARVITPGLACEVIVVD